MINKPPLKVIKIGGDIIEKPMEIQSILKGFSKIKGHKILIHGGGKSASNLSKKMGIPTRMINGRRVTDSATLEVITMVYAGKVNKQIVATLQSMSCNAIGLSGADGNSILSEKRPVKDHDFGFVGDIKKVYTQPIRALLKGNITPVFCAITHDGKGQLLNTNADTIASEIAIAMSLKYETSLYYCFGMKGVMRDVSDQNSIIPTISPTTYKHLISQGVISEGMLPKLENGFHALHHQVSEVSIGSAIMLESTETLRTTLML